MTTLTPTKSTGGTTKALPGVYVEADQQMTEEMLDQALPGAGLNSAFVAEFLSGMLAHERCGRHLYRTCEQRSNNPVLQAKYREFGAETERHVEILEQLITDGGGSPMYVGPTARAVLGTDTKLVEATYMLEGSLDPMTSEMAMLDAVFLAESMDHANWQLFSQLTEQLKDTEWYEPFRAAADEVESQEDEHLTWATQTKSRLVLMQAKSESMATLGAKAEEAVARVRNWLAD
jgi:rubrerythrin